MSAGSNNTKTDFTQHGCWKQNHEEGASCWAIVTSCCDQAGFTSQTTLVSLYQAVLKSLQYQSLHHNSSWDKKLNIASLIFALRVVQCAMTLVSFGRRCSVTSADCTLCKVKAAAMHTTSTFDRQLCLSPLTWIAGKEGTKLWSIFHVGLSISHVGLSNGSQSCKANEPTGLGR